MKQFCALVASFSQKAEPISAWKVYFRSSPGEIYAPNPMNPSVSHCARSEENFFAASFFLEVVGAKLGKQQRERPLKSKLSG